MIPFFELHQLTLVHSGLACLDFFRVPSHFAL
jgi:hypothetical protein